MNDWLRFHYSEIDSTNDVSKRLAHTGKIRQFAMITADSQTAGKGTQGRKWLSPPNTGIYLSVIHRHTDQWPLALSNLYTLAAGVACVETLQQTFDLSCIRLKPINDLYCRGRKLGGILTESLVQNGRMHVLITGVGINIRPIPGVLESQLDRPKVSPISLEEILPRDRFRRLNRQELAEALAANIIQWNHKVMEGGSEIQQQFKSLSINK